MALIEHIVQSFAEQVGGGAGRGVRLPGRHVCLRYCRKMKPYGTKSCNFSPGNNITYINMINELERYAGFFRDD